MATIHSKLGNGQHVWVPDVRVERLECGDEVHGTCGFPHSLTVLRKGVAVGWITIETIGYGHAKAFGQDHGNSATVLVVDHNGPANPYVLGVPGNDDWSVDDPAETLAQKAYLAALERVRLASARERTCQELHQKRYLTSDEYMVARNALTEAERAFDAASAALNDEAVHQFLR